jgi:hypothetical protein
MNSSATFNHNSQYGGAGTQGVGGAVSDPYQILMSDPSFVSPPAVNATADGQWANAPRPSSLGNGLALQAGSRLVDGAVDPGTLPGLDTSLLEGIKRYVMTDITGVARPQGSGFDYGAYER